MSFSRRSASFSSMWLGDVTFDRLGYVPSNRSVNPKPEKTNLKYKLFIIVIKGFFKKMLRTTKFRPVGRGLRLVNLLSLAEREDLQQCITSKEHSAAPSNRDESRPTSDEPSKEAQEEAPLGHDHED